MPADDVNGAVLSHADLLRYRTYAAAVREEYAAYITRKIASILLSNRVPSPTPKTAWTPSKTLSTR